jgi:hypothetical protein
MAQLVINTTPEQDTAAQTLFARDFTKAPALTLAAWVRAQLVAVLDEWVQRIDAERRLNRAALYKAATPVDQAAIDAILAKYQ